MGPAVAVRHSPAGTRPAVRSVKPTAGWSETQELSKSDFGDLLPHGLHW
jgi:hypothetical protein